MNNFHVEAAKKLQAENLELLEALEDAVLQSCTMADGTLNSCATGSYADAMRTLAKRGRIEIVKDSGRCVIGRRKEDRRVP